MKPTKDMSIEELREELRQRKLAAFEQYAMLRKETPEFLAKCGMKHAADALDFAIKMNEARLKDWERNNPIS